MVVGLPLAPYNTITMFHNISFDVILCLMKTRKGINGDKEAVKRQASSKRTSNDEMPTLFHHKLPRKHP
ncbi:hypothetical protein E2C01_077315 [Portunus trituberculatus]|uniref:Uncharacterized protein n=1 Tax=Portunus trituberculatus TaxID=210409 RepID=A0A5B7IE37_PORTR|nr:hypothetical protein [Portunus trituberculatus]